MNVCMPVFLVQHLCSRRIVRTALTMSHLDTHREVNAQLWKSNVSARADSLHLSPPATKMKEASRAGCMSRVSEAINGSFEKVFERLGRFIARKPVIVMISSVLFFAGIASGMMRLQNETRSALLHCTVDQ